MIIEADSFAVIAFFLLRLYMEIENVISKLVFILKPKEIIRRHQFYHLQLLKHEFRGFYFSEFFLRC